jgi:pyrroline-5-carboxylate reductase
MNITFIGGGNMASALIGGLLQKNFAAKTIGVIEITAESRDRLQREYGVNTYADLSPAALACDVLVLAVKPQQLRELATQLLPLLAGQLVVSIAAGIRSADLSRWLGGYGLLVRAMPNTPAMVQAGMTGLYALLAVSAEQRRAAEAIMSAVGSVLWLDDESHMDGVTAVSGSGPAYVFYFIEALQQAAHELGFTPDEARRLSLETFAGASKLASMSDEDAAVLRQRVTSKGGTTERALQAMESAGVKQHIVEAVLAAAERSRELGEQLGQQG